MVLVKYKAVHLMGLSELNVFFQSAQFVKVSATMGTLYEQPLICGSFKKSEEIDDETLSPEVPSSISPRPPCGFELNVRRRGWDEVSEAGNSGMKK